MLQVIILIAALFVGYGIFDSIIVSFIIPAILILGYVLYKSFFSKE